MELAIPLLALGGTYVAINQNNQNKIAKSKKKNVSEGFQSAGSQRNYLPNTNNILNNSY